MESKSGQSDPTRPTFEGDVITVKREDSDDDSISGESLVVANAGNAKIPPEPQPGCSSAAGTMQEPEIFIVDDPEVEEMKKKFFNENPMLAKLTWAGFEASANFKAEQSIDASKACDNTFDDLDFVSEAGDLRNGPFEKTKKGNLKETFRCNYCDNLIINSRDTMRSHIRGRPHKERVDEAKEDFRNGLIPELPDSEITPIRNEERLRKKVPLRLQVKIQTLPDAFVGLEFIEEYLPLSTDEVEPYYECFLCPSQGEANGMATHITSAKHIRNYLHARFPNDRKICDMVRADLVKLANQHNQKERLHLITTYESDILFHWQPGKSPWCHEQGGDGMAPKNSREMMNKGIKNDDPLWAQLHLNRKEIREMIPTLRVPSGEHLGVIKTDDEALEALQYMEELVSDLTAFKINDLDANEREELEVTVATINVKIAIMKSKLLRKASRRSPTPPSVSSRRPRSPSPRSSDRQRLGSAARRSPSPRSSDRHSLSRRARSPLDSRQTHQSSSSSRRRKSPSPHRSARRSRTPSPDSYRRPGATAMRSPTSKRRHLSYSRRRSMSRSPDRTPSPPPISIKPETIQLSSSSSSTSSSSLSSSDDDKYKKKKKKKKRDQKKSRK